MADNVAVTAGTGTSIAADDIGGILHQRVKISQGADGTGVDVSSAAPLQVTLANTGANTNKILTTPDTHAVTQSGTWTVQPGNTANTTAWKVDGSAVTQPVSGTLTGVTTVTTLTGTTTLTPGTGAANLGKAEDAAHSDGDVGVMALAVRKNTAAATSGSDGDYNPVSVNTRGATWVAIEDGSGGQVTSFSGPTQYTEDGAAASDPVGSMLMAVRRDTLSTSEVSADGDNIALKASNKGKLHVAAETRFGDTVADTGSGTGGSATQRVIIDSAQLAALSTTAAAMSGGYQLVGLATDSPGVIADDAAFTPATTRVIMSGYQADETSTDSVDEGDGGAARMTLDRKQIVTIQPHTAGGLSIYKSLDLDEGACEVVKASPGQVYSAWITNRSTSTRYIKFYDATSGTIGTGTPVITVGVPGNATDNTAAILSSGGHGILFATGISIGASTGFADNDTGAPGTNDVVINVFYK